MSPIGCVLIVILAVAGCLAPVAYLAWWGFFYDGQDAAIQHNIEELLADAPKDKAQIALKKKDYSLYCSGGMWEPSVPGIGLPIKNYRELFGYRNFSVYEGEHLTAEQQDLNTRALKYMIAYNKIIFAEVNTQYPNWSKE